MTKIYYTKEEVIADLEKYSKERNIEIDMTPFYELGFECIHNFCKTSNGWVPSFEDCCPYCVHIIIKHHGTKEDKITFNKNSTLGERYIIPLTRKEVALDKKKERKNKSSYIDKKMSNKELGEKLKEMRTKGIPIIGRGKKNLYDDVFMYADLGKGLSCEMIYVKGLEAQFAIPCLSSEKEIEEEISNLLEKQKKSI